MGMGEDIEQQQHQEPSFKHFCKVCKRGFGCAGALGGHMRSHSVGDVRFHQSSHEQEVGKDNVMRSRPDGVSKRHSYFLRTNTNRFTSYRVSEYLHYKPAKFASPLSSSESEVEEMMKESIGAKSENYEDQHSASSEDEDLANCLVMLSNKSFVLSDKEKENKAKKVEKGMFQCKACQKVFNSHQALGGHRASHKKVKGCYAAKFNNNLNEDEIIEDDIMNQHEELLAPSDNSSEPGLDLDFSPHHQLPNSTTLTKRKSRAHQCSICHRVFSSGQALGGHKRCHWLTSNPPDHTILHNLHEFQFDSQQLFKKPMLIKYEPPPLDLNFPPLLNNINAVNNLNTSSTYPFNNEAPGRFFLQLWGDDKVHDNNRDNQQQHYTKSVVHSPLHDLNNSTTSEDKCSLKQIAKLNDLEDMNLDGGSSRWLQVGIASTTDTIATP